MSIKKDKELIVKAINAKLAQADVLLAECVLLAEEGGVCFSLPWGGEGTSQRGMGATYVPETASELEKRYNCNESWNGEYQAGWQPSAQSC
jgi:hypothetical protein